MHKNVPRINDRRHADKRGGVFMDSEILWPNTATKAVAVLEDSCWQLSLMNEHRTDRECNGERHSASTSNGVELGVNEYNLPQESTSG